MLSRYPIFTLLGTLALAAEPVAPQPKAAAAGTAVLIPAPPGQSWLGVQLGKVDPFMSAHIPALPQGVGFVIKSIEAGGPGEIAKLQLFDVVWKLGDQMLVNEAQLATLLRLSKPGDEATLAIFRAGQLLEVKMKLGDLPPEKRGFPSELAETAILPNEGGPMRVVNVAEKTASYSTDEGKAVLRREGGVYLVVIKNAKEEVIFEGDVTSRDNLSGVPQAWQRRVCALRRGLDHAVDAGMVQVRPPRPRVAPQPLPASPDKQD